MGKRGGWPPPPKPRSLLSCLGVVIHRRTDADQVTVAPCVVHTVHRWPVFVHTEGTRRETALLASVGTIPVFHQIFHGVRRVFQRVVFRINPTFFDVANFFANGQHRITEPIQLSLVLRLSWLNHQRARNRPAHGWRVEATVDQTFRNVIHGHTGTVRKRTGVDDTLMRHTAGWAFVEHVKRTFETLGDVVAVQDRHTSRLCQPFAAHHQHIGPADWQDRGRSKWRR
mmetsp:Transcript_27572/g.51150  ORF Transcript_27572/g.51150 Transcript_27572/m.51150 type:complete len:227 (-) Transcript_27572:4156-4836(-)